MNKIYIIALMFLATITAKAQNDITVHDDQTGKDEEIGEYLELSIGDN